MSFSSETKKELTLLMPEKKCDMLAEISGFVRMNGSIRLMGGGRMNVSLITEDPAVARLFKQLIQACFDAGTSLDIYKETVMRRKKTYRLTFDDGTVAERMLREIGLLSVREGGHVLMEGIPQKGLRKKCCRRAYLRGCFLANGSVTHPERSYHLEVVCETPYIAEDLKKLMNGFQLNARVTERKHQWVVYIKESERIVDFLNIIGAHGQLLKYEDVRAMKSLRNRTNRIVNCENANVDKSIAAAGRHRENILYIDSRFGLERLPEKLRATASLRMEYPELSLDELAGLLEPPVSKSGLNHRLNRIDQIAEKLREEERMESR